MQMLGKACVAVMQAFLIKTEDIADWINRIHMKRKDRSISELIPVSIFLAKISAIFIQKMTRLQQLTDFPHCVFPNSQ
jgi:hypothetical protein